MTAPMAFGLPGGRGELGPPGHSSHRAAVRAADQLGYDCLWFTDEPARTDDGSAWRTRRSAVAMATAAADATSRIRVGVGVPPHVVHRPVRLAADLATLDVLSAGRANLVVGPVGGAEGQLDALGTALDTLVECWTGQPVRLDGDWHLVEPIPAQQPHPPLYIAARDDEAVAWTARRGHGLILAGALPTHAVRRQLQVYTAHGGDVATVRVERFCFVAASDELAREAGGPYVEQLAAYLRATMAPTDRAGVGDDAFELDRFVAETVIAGGPETAAVRIAELRDQLGVRRVNVRPSLRGHCPFGLQQATVGLFATKVVPLLAEIPAPVAP